MYELVLASAARKAFLAADPPLRRKLKRCFDWLEQQPYSHPNIKALKGDFKGFYRFRVGDWRVIYRVNEQEHRVYISEIAHRRDIYE